MAKVSKTIVDKAIRDAVFSELFNEGWDWSNYVKINDRQYGTIIIDANGEQRYARVGVIVAELREDMTAEELMQSEMDAYDAKQKAKAEKAAKKEAKIARDKTRRAAEAEAKEKDE